LAYVVGRNVFKFPLFYIISPDQAATILFRN
jgi:hypothetical protein